MSDKSKRLFINNNLLMSECGFEKLRGFLAENEVLHHSIISGITEDELIVIPPSTRYSLTDTAFQYHVEQYVKDGYIYLSLESLKKMLGL